MRSALADLHSGCGSVGDAWCSLRRMEKRDAVAWNSVIGWLGDDAF